MKNGKGKRSKAKTNKKIYNKTMKSHLKKAKKGSTSSRELTKGMPKNARASRRSLKGKRYKKIK